MLTHKQKMNEYKTDQPLLAMRSYMTIAEPRNAILGTSILLNFTFRLNRLQNEMGYNDK